jgi:hypothetical protein
MNMKNDNPTASSIRARVIQSLTNVGLWPGDDATRKSFIESVRSPVDKNKDLFPNRVPMSVFENIAILKIAFGFNNTGVKDVASGNTSVVEGKLKAREAEITFLADAYQHAKSQFPKLRQALQSGKAFHEMSLKQMMSSTHSGQASNTSAPAAPLHIVRALEKVRWSEEYQEGNPDAICIAAEHYLAAGAMEIAEPLIQEVLDVHSEHPGGWFQKSRLQLEKSKQAARKATRYKVMSEDADVLSAAERHYEELAFDEADASRSLEDQAFETCITAYKLLPDNKSYEQSAIKWSRDYGTLRELRHRMLLFIVSMAAKRCDPNAYNSPVFERVRARLGRVKKYDPKTGGSTPDLDKITELSALPLFSADTDALVLSAYDELMNKSHWGHFDRTALRLNSLNFFRLLAPKPVYHDEVEKFVEDLKRGIPEDSCRYFGVFSDPEWLTGWRNTLHEHLDAVMSRHEQRELVRELHRAWVTDIEKRRDDALLSIYDDELRMKFDASDPLGAFDVAVRGENEGIYRRDDGHGALVLRRTAQHAELAADKKYSSNATIRYLLQDQSLQSVAEEYYDQCLAESDPIDGPDPFPEYLYEVNSD